MDSAQFVSLAVIPPKGIHRLKTNELKTSIALQASSYEMRDSEIV
jgi:hypothetical protein